MSRTDETATNAIAFFLNHTRDGLILTDVQRRITLINPAAASLLELSPGQVIGTVIDDSLHAYPPLLDLLDGEALSVLRIFLPRRRSAQAQAARLADGSCALLLLDETALTELETRRSALVSSIVHDLRNPISAISGFAELVERGDALTESQGRFLTRLRQTTAKLHELAPSLVELAWIESGMPLESRPVDMDLLIARVVSAEDSAAASHHVTIATSIQHPLPLIHGDAQRLGLAVRQVLHNAIIYSHPQQTIALHAWGDDDACTISIADQGIGIAEDECDMVFDRMFRSRDERVRAIPGGGLGLTLARTIITRHGGDIHVTSVVNQGSTFTLTLPTHSPTKTP